MTRRTFAFVMVALAPSAAFVACGSRTGLLAPEEEPDVHDASKDTKHEPDAIPPLDVSKKDITPPSDCPDADSTLVYVVAVGG